MSVVFKKVGLAKVGVIQINVDLIIKEKYVHNAKLLKKKAQVEHTLDLELIINVSNAQNIFGF